MSREERPYFDSLTRASRRVLTTIGLEPHRRRAESLADPVSRRHRPERPAEGLFHRGARPEEQQDCLRTDWD